MNRPAAERTFTHPKLNARQTQLFQKAMEFSLSGGEPLLLAKTVN